MKFMLIMNSRRDGYTQYMSWPKNLLEANAAFMQNFTKICCRQRSPPSHDEAARVADTDWPQILALYSVLKRMSDNPMAVLSHAIATAMVHGPEAGLDLLKPLDDDERLRGHHRLDAVRAHLLERAGNREAAISLYRAAAEKTTSVPERNYLVMRAARLVDPPS